MLLPSYVYTILLSSFLPTNKKGLHMNQVIQDLEQKLTEAEKAGDETLLTELIAEDFTGINMKGMRVDRNGFIFGLCKAGITFENLTIENLQITITEGQAVVFGKSIFSVVMNGTTIEGTAEYLDIWQQHNSQWKLHYSSVTPSR